MRTAVRPALLANSIKWDEAELTALDLSCNFIEDRGKQALAER